MNLYDLLSDNASLNVTINAGQLIEAIDYCIDKTREEPGHRDTDIENGTCLNVGQTAQILDVNTGTLRHWNKSGYLCPVSTGGQRRYRVSDIKKILRLSP